MSILLSIASKYITAWYRKNDANLSFFLNFSYGISGAMIKKLIAAHFFIPLNVF